MKSYLSFLPPKLREEVTSSINQGLKELKKIKWPIRAVVLGGGFKDGEVAYVGDEILSDIDLYIFSNFVSFFWEKISRAEKKINQESQVPFHFHGVIPFLLSRSRTYWAYRLKYGGIVLKGDREILRKIRATSDNIPKIEAIRILFWNLALWLNKPTNPYRILRSYLNLGESYLTFAGKLAPSFKERIKRVDEIAEEFNLSGDLLKKIKLGYKTRTSSLKTEWGKGLSLDEARRDCLRAINQLLSLYLKTNVSLEEKMNLLAKRIPAKYLFNFFFYFFLRKRKEIKPKFFQILFKFKITELWKMAIYNAMNDRERIDFILNKYFFVKEFSEKILTKIYESYPSPSFREIF
jgi:hypothetical protein